MTAVVKAGTIDPLLHPRDAAQMLNVSISWLAKSRLSGAGPQYVKIGRVKHPGVHQEPDAGIDQ
jgi:hypothetical protein